MMSLFINTRPTHKHGIHLPIATVHLPLLSIHRFDELHPAESQDLADFIKGRFATLIVVSVEAASCAMDFLKKHHVYHAHDLPHHDTLTVIAIGHPTAQILRDFGFRVLTPQEAGCEMSNEGILAMPSIARLGAHDDVLIWRGVGGRRLLFDELTSRGAYVRAITFYERCVPPHLVEDFARLLDDHAHTPKPNHTHDAVIFVLITSQMSLQAWQSVYDAWAEALPSDEPDSLDALAGVAQPSYDTPPNHGFLPQNMIYLTLGKRLGALTAAHYPNSRVHIVTDLTQETLSSTIKTLLAKHTPTCSHLGGAAFNLNQHLHS